MAAVNQSPQSIMKYSILLGCATAMLVCANAAVAKTSPATPELAASQTIALAQQDADSYIQSAAQKIDTDPQGALADLNRSIQVDAKSYRAYFFRGLLKYRKLDDYKGALLDFDRSISLNDKYAPSYSIRGIVKLQKLKDSKGAISDFDKSLALEEDYLVYALRGAARYTLSDTQGAIADVRKSRQIAQAKGETEFVKTATNMLREMGVNE
jgi:tetratricopeptide (TPR) repeat protein